MRILWYPCIIIIGILFLKGPAFSHEIYSLDSIHHDSVAPSFPLDDMGRFSKALNEVEEADTFTVVNSISLNSVPGEPAIFNQDGDLIFSPPLSGVFLLVGSALIGAGLLRRYKVRKELGLPQDF